MPGSSALAARTSASSASEDEVVPASIHKVGAHKLNLEEAMAGAMRAPLPQDVAHMLERYGASLPGYLDVQLRRDAATARQRWPVLKLTLAAAGPRCR